MIHTKRLTALILALAITMLAGCGTGHPETASEPPAERIAMLENWHAILEVNESVWSQIFWAYGYTDAFCESNDWNALLTARAAASAALLALEDTRLPECTLTEEQIGELIRDGIEGDAVTMEYEALESTFQSRRDTLILLNTHLNNDVFLTQDLEVIGLWLESSYRCSQLEIEYLWTATNYLLLQLEPTVNPNEQWEQWKKAFPTMAAYAPGWETDPDVLMDHTNTLLDTLSEELIRYNGYLGRSEDSILMVHQALESGDLTTLAKNINTMANVPEYIPTPFWLDAALLENFPVYYLKDPETDEILLIQSEQDLDQRPSGCYLALPTVAKSDVEDYAILLEGMGFAVKTEWEEDAQTLKLIAAGSQCAFLVEWSGETATLLMTDPIGCMTPYLYLLAMNQA